MRAGTPQWTILKPFSTTTRALNLQAAFREKASEFYLLAFVTTNKQESRRDGGPRTDGRTDKRTDADGIDTERAHG